MTFSKRREEHTRALAAVTLKLERTLSDLADQAYCLTRRRLLQACFRPPCALLPGQATRTRPQR
jgi:hypothetical protein